MSVSVRGKVPTGWDAQTSRHITERLQALERALAGGAQAFVAPSIPSFGSGTVTGGAGSSGGSGSSGGGTVTIIEEQSLAPSVPTPHVHGPDDVLMLDQRFYRRGEAAQAAPHVHNAADVVGLDVGVQGMPPHVHLSAHVVDLRPEDSEWILAQRIFGGYGG